MLDQEKFFNTYKVQEAFEDSGLSWDTLEKIYEDYKSRLPEMKKDGRSFTGRNIKRDRFSCTFNS